MFETPGPGLCGNHVGRPAQQDIGGTSGEDDLGRLQGSDG